MPWDLYFTILFQIIIAIVLLTIPIMFFAYMVFGSASEGMLRGVKNLLRSADRQGQQK